MWPMRNAWRTMSSGFSSTGPVEMAASAAGSGGRPTGRGKVAFMRSRVFVSGARRDGAEDLVGRVRLGDVALHTEHLCPDAIGLLALAGDEHHGNALGRRVAADGARGGEAVHLVHVDVHENDV